MANLKITNKKTRSRGGIIKQIAIKETLGIEELNELFKPFQLEQKVFNELRNQLAAGTHTKEQTSFDALIHN